MADDRTFLHVDMDAFFAAVEQREQPELRGRPVIVGASPNARGVVSTCSYEARVFGVHSAMPSRTAYRLCPQGVFVPVRGELYQAVSREIFTIFAKFSPFVEPLSIDEAFLDITGSMHLFGGAVATGNALRQCIHDETQLTASVGVAPNKFLAKLASDMDKPDGITVVPRAPDEIRAFLAPLPIRRIWGVGQKTAAHLEAAGLTCIGDLQCLIREELQQLLGEAGGWHIHELSWGRDSREIAMDTPDKSISAEHTFGEDVRCWDQVERTALKLAEKVGARLRGQGKRATTIHIKIRWTPFRTITRQVRCQPPIDSDRELIAKAMELLTRERSNQGVRLVGFAVSGFVDADEDVVYQPDLFREDPVIERERNESLDSAVDSVRQRFGRSSLQRANWKKRKKR